MEQSVSRPTDYRLALHDNMVGKDTGERNKAGREEGTMDGERRGFMLPLNGCRPVRASEGRYQ